MKFTKKRGALGTWHTYHGSYEYCITGAPKGWRVQICDDGKCLYDTAVHSEDMILNGMDLAKKFVEELIEGSCDWRRDVERYKSKQAEKAVKIEAREKDEVDAFLDSLKKHSLSISDFLSLYEAFDNMSSTRHLIYQAAEKES